jgi:hypothetical protein
MSVKLFIGAVFFFLSICGKPPDKFPHTEITNGIIRAKIFLPDSKDGYYRGSRFDWSGVIPELEYMGHSYFGKWFEKYDPHITDAIMGPVEEFAPVGFDEAKAGDNFLKIGVGMLVKQDEAKYFFSTPYQIVNAGTWKVKKKADHVAFIQQLKSQEYAYEYKKTVELTKGKAEMVLSHTLKNTGQKNIETNVYDHNFFVMDNQLTGPDVTISFLFKPTGDAGKTASFGNLQDTQIRFQKELVNNDHLQYKSIQGYSNSPKDYDIRIENHKTGAAVRITCDQPLSNLAFWSASKTVCPEPYIRVNIKSGETFKWKIFYQFYLCEILQS